MGILNMRTFGCVAILAAVFCVTSGSCSSEELDLDGLQRMALADSPSLQAVAARVDQAQARVTQSASTFYPRLDLSASGSRTWLAEDTSGSFGQLQFLADLFAQFQGDLGDIEIEPTTSFETYSAGITANWLLFDGFGRTFRHAVALSGAREAEMAYLESKRLLLDAVASAYHSAQLAREQIQIAEADEAFNLRLLEEAKARRRVGTGSLSDELNFEVRLNVARTTLIDAREYLATVLIGLAALVGVPEAEFGEGITLAPLAQVSPEDMIVPEVAPLIEYAYEHRPDLAQSRLAVKRAEAALNATRSAFLPSLSAMASHEGRSNDDELHEEEFSTTVALSLSYNLFAGGGDRAQFVEADAALKEAKRTLAASEIEVASDTRQAVERLRAAQDDLQLQRKNAANVQRNRDLVEKEYVAGQGSLVRLNEAQRDLTQTHARLALARVSLCQAWHNLRTATGETLETLAD